MTWKQDVDTDNKLHRCSTLAFSSTSKYKNTQQFIKEVWNEAFYRISYKICIWHIKFYMENIKLYFLQYNSTVWHLILETLLFDDLYLLVKTVLFSLTWECAGVSPVTMSGSVNILQRKLEETAVTGADAQVADSFVIRSLVLRVLRWVMWTRFFNGTQVRGHVRGLGSVLSKPLSSLPGGHQIRGLLISFINIWCLIKRVGQYWLLLKNNCSTFHCRDIQIRIALAAVDISATPLDDVEDGHGGDDDDNDSSKSDREYDDKVLMNILDASIINNDIFSQFVRGLTLATLVRSHGEVHGSKLCVVGINLYVWHWLLVENIRVQYCDVCSVAADLYYWGWYFSRIWCSLLTGVTYNGRLPWTPNFAWQFWRLQLTAK